MNGSPRGGCSDEDGSNGPPSPDDFPAEDPVTRRLASFSFVALASSLSLALHAAPLAQDVQANLGSFGAPRTPDAWIDAPRALDTELRFNNHELHAAEDLDGDGLDDLLLFRNIPAPIFPITNRGGGHFERAPGFGFSLSKFVIGTGDLTGDGRPDLVRDDLGTGNGILFFENQGGTFGTPVSSSTPGLRPIQGAVGQADGDAALELLEISEDIVTGANYARWWDFEGGVLVPHTPIFIGPDVASVALGDLDGDGRDDVLLSPFFSDQVLTLGTSAALGLELLHTLNVPTGVAVTSFALLNLAIADLDGDEDVDAIVGWNTTISSGRSTGHIIVLENTGSLPLTPHPAVDQSGPKVTGAACVDWDLDGDQDVILTGDYVTQFENRGRLRFRDAGLIPLDRASGIGKPLIAVRDLNGDGFPDVLTGNRLKFGSGRFEDTAAEPFPLGVGGHAADLDGDGDLDYGSYQGLLYLNDGEGGFEARTVAELLVPSLPPAPVQLRVVGDLNGDGDVDLILHHIGPANTADWLILGLGDGTFTYAGLAAPLNQTVTSPGLIACPPVDLDGDGDLDLVVDNGWAENDGAGFFGTVHPEWSGAPIDCADVDLDGDIDVGIRITGSLARLFRNDGTGSFQETRLSPNSEGRAQFVDVDDDGFVDFVTGTPLDEVEVTPSLAGVFTAPPILLDAAPQDEIFIVVQDYDGDGRRDVLGVHAPQFTGYTERPMIWRQSDGPVLAFDEPRHYFTDIGVDVAGDFDGDGDIDLARRRMIRTWRAQPRSKVQSLRPGSR